jgi:outer membrane biosynthesis protein TonB
LFPVCGNNAQKLLAYLVGRDNPVTPSQLSVPKKSKAPTKEAEVISPPAVNHAETPVARSPVRSATQPRKTPAKKTPRSSKKAAGSRPAKSRTEPTDEEIRLRAYFISERRHRFALPGDASSDWLEAKRQLLSEIGPR